MLQKWLHFAETTLVTIEKRVGPVYELKLLEAKLEREPRVKGELIYTQFHIPLFISSWI